MIAFKFPATAYWFIQLKKCNLLLDIKQLTNNYDNSNIYDWRVAIRNSNEAHYYGGRNIN